MDKIPLDVKASIYKKTHDYAKENLPKQVTLPAFNDGAFYGYSLASNRLQIAKQALSEIEEKLRIGIYDTVELSEVLSIAAEALNKINSLP